MATKDTKRYFVLVIVDSHVEVCALVVKMMHREKLPAWFGAFQPLTASPLIDTTFGVEGTQGSHEPIE